MSSDRVGGGFLDRAAEDETHPSPLRPKGPAFAEDAQALASAQAPQALPPAATLGRGALRGRGFEASGTASLLAMQQTYGNRAVQRFLQRSAAAPADGRPQSQELQAARPLLAMQRQPESPDLTEQAQEAGARGRTLPKGFEGKKKAGNSRARTMEETAIDVAGEGSELKALVTNPGQTLANAFTGLFSGFPSRATIRQQPAVQAAISSAWTAAQGDYAERFGWITWDKNTGAYNVPAVAVGDQYQCTPPPKPADPAPGDANQVFHVGEFHLHPPLDPSIPEMQTPTDWPIGPSDTDENAAQADHSPGIVRDFDTVMRDGGVTDYTYGPWTRTD